MTIQTTRHQRQALKAANRAQPTRMTRVPEALWPPFPPEWRPVRVWRSRDYLAQLYVVMASDGTHEGFRLSVCRPELGPAGRWKDGLTWDDLQTVKTQCGYGDCWAIEVFPPVDAVISVANLRHLWLVRVHELPDWVGWRQAEDQA